MQTLLITCRLADPLLIQHASQAPQLTYSRGSHRIDYVFVSRNLLPAGLCTGFLPYDSIFLSDHRACYVDSDVKALFKYTVSVIAPAKYHSLQ
jgi:hypothetical protein